MAATYLIRVQLNQLIVVCLRKGEEGGGHAAVGSSVCDVTHSKEEPHLTNHLAAAWSSGAAKTGTAEAGANSEGWQQPIFIVHCFT